MLDRPPVCILCPTYGRAGQLAELVECFRRQTYTGQLRLVILNDRHNQEFHTAVPGVVIVNAAHRFETLGLKFAALLGHAWEPFVQWWDDDDIFLPDHVTQSIDKMRDDEPGGRLLYEYQERADGSLEVRHAGMRGMTLRTDALRAVGMPLTDRDQWNVLIPTMVRRGWFSGAHHSAITCAPTIIARLHHDTMRATGRTADELTVSVDRRQGLGLEPSGRIDLVPAWRDDYVARVRNLFKNPVTTVEEP
jgi:hypothetical protein